MILEEILLESMFHLPSEKKVKEIVVTHLSVGLMKLRLKDSFRMVAGRSADTPVRTDAAAASGNNLAGGTGDADKSVGAPTYRVIGQPEDLDGAKSLAEHDWYGFAACRPARSISTVTRRLCPLSHPELWLLGANDTLALE